MKSVQTNQFTAEELYHLTAKPLLSGVLSLRPPSPPFCTQGLVTQLSQCSHFLKTEQETANLWRQKWGILSHLESIQYPNFRKPKERKSNCQTDRSSVVGHRCHPAPGTVTNRAYIYIRQGNVCTANSQSESRCQ